MMKNVFWIFDFRFWRCFHNPKSKIENQKSFVKGQSTLEYALVLSAILVALVAVATTVMRPAVTTSLTNSAGVITGAAGRLQGGLGLN